MKFIKINGMVMILSIILISSLIDIACAHRFRGPAGPGATVHINHVIRVAPRPPGWPQMWLAADVIKTFTGNGLTVEKTKKDADIELSGLSAKTKEAIRFSVSLNSRQLQGCVLEFHEKNEFDKVKKHYLALNNNGKLHTWSLSRDNILLVIDGSMPDMVIRKYATVLAEME